MNKIYKTVWCEATRTWVAVSENAVGHAGGTSKIVEPALETKRFLKVTLLGAAALLALGMVGPFAHEAHAASNTGLCLTYKGGTNNVSGNGGVLSNGCNSAAWINGLTPGGSTDWVGLTADDTQVVLDGNAGKIYFRTGGANGNVLTMSNATDGILLSGVAAGVRSTDAVNMSQLNSLSTSTASSVSSLSTSTASEIASLSTSTAGDIASLSDSTANSLASLSTSTSGSIASLSTSTNSGFASLSTSTEASITALSTSTNNGFASLSTSTANSITSLSTSTAESIASLSTSMLSTGASVVTQDAATGAISVGAESTGRTVDFAGSEGTRTLTGISAGVEDTDAVNVSQLHSLSTTTSNSLTSLSTGLSSSERDVSSLSTSLLGTADEVATLSTRLSTVNANLSDLGATINGLQTSMGNAVSYDDSSRAFITLGGVGATNAVLLTNVAAGTISATSTDAVNGSQVHTLQQDFAAQYDVLTSQVSSLSTAVVGLESAASENAAVSPDSSTASGDNSTATGTNSTATGENSTATG
ncbi:TPA: hypothetical protein QDB15_004081, partial [Burkholderia vietnamiensis]|nr:hypothetical protein [Burkholderia vietnamiensis]HDR9120264.1 hypothetical protein [Burkholderia vietnamiensis]